MSEMTWLLRMLFIAPPSHLCYHHQSSEKPRSLLVGTVSLRHTAMA